MFKRAYKIKHFVSSKISEKNSLRKLRNMDSFGSEIAKAFNSTKFNKFSDELKPVFSELEEYRKKLLHSDQKIDFTIFEEGDIKLTKEVCKKAASPEKWCRLFFFLTYYSKASGVLEIGTNLGVSGQYYLKALLLNNTINTNFKTLDGVQDLCNISEKRFSEINSERNFKVICGMYSDTLPEIENSDDQYQIIFIDGNHKFKPTIEYYTMLYNNLTDRAIIIFDDINWSREMKKAWSHIKKMRFEYSIDLYKLGIIVVNKNNTDAKKLNFKLFLSY